MEVNLWVTSGGWPGTAVAKRRAQTGRPPRTGRKTGSFGDACGGSQPSGSLAF